MLSMQAAHRSEFFPVVVVPFSLMRQVYLIKIIHGLYSDVSDWTSF